MRILMLSANTGEGHNSTAKAIIDALQTQGADCDLIDCLSFFSPRFSKFICNWHTRLYKYAPKLVDAGYDLLERTGSYQEDGVPARELFRLSVQKLWQLLQENQYSAVVCVHVFAGLMMTQLRKDFLCAVPCYFVATDYTCSPTVELCHMDGYFIPHKALEEEFVRAGLPRQRLLPCGIPVRSVFYQCQEMPQARKQLALPESGCIVLLMCGSMGCGPMRKLAKALLQQLPAGAVLVAVCGNNEKLKESLLGIQAPNLQVLGYTDQISTYMDAADIVVTKPGGLSSTEAANKHVPTVLINVVGGCESRNFDFFLANGFATGSDDVQQVTRQTVQLAANPRRREQMRQLLAEHFCTNSAQTIAELVIAKS